MIEPSDISVAGLVGAVSLHSSLPFTLPFTNARPHTTAVLQDIVQRTLAPLVHKDGLISDTNHYAHWSGCARVPRTETTRTQDSRIHREMTS